MALEKFVTDGPLLIIAPHQIYPARNGADILVDRIAKHVSFMVPYVDIICESEIKRYIKGKDLILKKFENKQRSRLLAAVRTILFRTNYLNERFNTKKFRAVFDKYFETNSCKNILLSFNTGLDLMRGRTITDTFNMVVTHNDDYKYFQDMMGSSSNPITKLMGKISCIWLKKIIDDNIKDYFFLHVADSDLSGYKKMNPLHKGIRMSIGADVEEANLKYLNLLPTNKIVLTFTGSLSMKMNEDALINLNKKFAPILFNSLGNNLTIRVVGSNPSKLIQDLCIDNNWELHPNVSDDKMRELIQSSTFTIMPFEYSNGAKLKFLNSISNGTPILATNVFKNDDLKIPLCLYSDEPEQWVKHIKINNNKVNDINERKKIFDFSKQFSWENSIQDMVMNLSSTTHLHTIN